MKNSKSRKKYGFTLIELMVAVIIIAVLAAVAVPQYKKAVLKSRYSTLMPLAKSLADGNEIYYVANGHYADELADLDVAGQKSYEDGTKLEVVDDDNESYVLATRENDFPNKYIIYQKYSKNFAGNVHCEALSTNASAGEVCVALGGKYLDTHGDYTVYILSGNSTGIFPKSSEKIVKTRESCYNLPSDNQCLASYEYEDGHVRNFEKMKNGVILVKDYTAESKALTSVRGYGSTGDPQVTSGNWEKDPQTGEYLWEGWSDGLYIYTDSQFDTVRFNTSGIEDKKLKDVSWTDSNGYKYTQERSNWLLIEEPGGKVFRYNSSGQLHYIGVPNAGIINFSTSGENAGTIQYGNSFCKTAEECAPYIPSQLPAYQTYDVSQITMEDYIDMRSYCERYSHMCSN